MKNKAICKLIDSGLLEGKRIFSTNKPYKRFLRSSKNTRKLICLKPHGLWYAIGSHWLQWCCDNNFDGIGKYIYEIELCPTNILFLSEKKDIYSFSEKYAEKISVFSVRTSIFIEWLKVMRDYDGIEANPYFHDLGIMSHLIWYYGWDVPSGCIWKTSAKKKVTLLAEYKPRKKEFIMLQ